MSKKLYKINVSGRVQGVGFRRYVVNEARFLGLKGIVRNLPDGNVCIEAEGDEENLDIFLIWCRKSPGFSFVESLSFEAFPPVNHSGFRIEY